ncbi:hypothetical protein BKA67DRAFT_506592, partial [Truncatella angustata]
LIKQLKAKPISEEQLAAEVAGIYAGLIMVEDKCIEVDDAQSLSSPTETKLHNQQWQALIALHRTLLHEYYDFLLASQHPSASPGLRRMASEYHMPTRIWCRGIHPLLELLRRRLPESEEHMLTYIFLAYNIMTLLYETVPAFQDTWVKYLDNLARYRMAIEDDCLEMEVWTSVSRDWYFRASDKALTTGGPYHHLAIVTTHNNASQRLFNYSKSI